METDTRNNCKNIIPITFQVASPRASTSGCTSPSSPSPPRTRRATRTRTPPRRTPPTRSSASSPSSQGFSSSSSGELCKYVLSCVRKVSCLQSYVETDICKDRGSPCHRYDAWFSSLGSCSRCVTLDGSHLRPSFLPFAENSKAIR